MRLHYLVKLKIRVFCEASNAGKAKLKKFYLLTMILPIQKDTTFWLWHHVMANLTRKICTKLYQNRPHFVKDMTEKFWCLFRFTVLAAVHLQNANASFTRYSRGTFQVRRKTFTFLCDKFTQDNNTCVKFYHNRSGFVDCISKNILMCSFLVHSADRVRDCLCFDCWQTYTASRKPSGTTCYLVVESSSLAVFTSQCGTGLVSTIAYLVLPVLRNKLLYSIHTLWKAGTYRMTIDTVLGQTGVVTSGQSVSFNNLSKCCLLKMTASRRGATSSILWSAGQCVRLCNDMHCVCRNSKQLQQRTRYNK